MLIEKYDNFVFSFYGTLTRIEINEYSDFIWDKLATYMGFMGVIYSPAELKESYFRICEQMTKKKDESIHYPDIDIVEVFKRLYLEKKEVYDIFIYQNTALVFRFLSINKLEMYRGVKEIFDYLKMNNKNIYVFSTGQRIFAVGELKSLGIYDDYITGDYYSSDAGIRKPNAEFIKEALNKHGLNSENTVIIGNDFENDIVPACGLGMETVFIKTDLSPEVNDYKGIRAGNTIWDGEFGRFFDFL